VHQQASKALNQLSKGSQNGSKPQIQLVPRAKTANSKMIDISASQYNTGTNGSQGSSRAQLNTKTVQPNKKSRRTQEITSDMSQNSLAQSFGGGPSGYSTVVAGNGSKNAQLNSSQQLAGRKTDLKTDKNAAVGRALHQSSTTRAQQSNSQKKQLKQQAPGATFPRSNNVGPLGPQPPMQMPYNPSSGRKTPGPPV
jgi:hypothetical protein